MASLRDRVTSYAEEVNYKLLPRVPVIISLNGRGFSKVTSILEKPFSKSLSDCFSSTALKLCSEIDGAFFSYHHNDDITVIIRNDQSIDSQPWYDNRIQKLSSSVASIATLNFYKYSIQEELNLLPDPIFLSHAYVVPSYEEAMNVVIAKQQQNIYSSIHFSCFYELLNKYDKPTIKDMLISLSLEEKVNLLKSECGIDYHDYPASFRRGVACYKTPKNINGTLKQKWIVNSDLPIFSSKENDMLQTIFKNSL